MTNLTYANAGVDTVLGDDASKVLYEAAKLTWVNRRGRLGEVMLPNDSFSGLRGINVEELPRGTRMTLGFDGDGTKVEVGQRTGRLDGLGIDLICMVADDMVRYGVEPVLVGSILDVRALSKRDPATGEVIESYLPQVKELAKGYIAGAEQAGVAVINGEIAELGHLVGGFGDFVFNWGAGAVGFYHEDRQITGAKIRPGQAIVAFAERGLRANGLSLFRKASEYSFGPNYQDTAEGRLWAERAIVPSVIYTPAILDIIGRFDDVPRAEVTGIAHITGGGIPGKLERLLSPTRYGASLYNLFPPLPVMNMVMAAGNVSETEMYKTLNGGQGMLVVTTEPTEVISIARKRGFGAQIAGEIITKPGIWLTTSSGITYGPKDWTKKK